MAMSYCSKCGRQLQDGVSFCPYCGHRVGASAAGKSGSNSELKSTVKSAKNSIIDGLNGYVGNKNTVKLNWRDLFTDIFKKHTKEEAEEIFIGGTAKTTPPLESVSDSWPRPWLYSRVFMCFVVTYILLLICSLSFQNPNAIPGLMIIGSFAVPFTTLVMFLEVNAFRNVSFYDAIKIFMIGGCASLVVTLCIFDMNIVDTSLESTWGAMMIGVVEEVGKLVIVYWFIKRMDCRYILPALLIGSCVGAGFAAFESAGYAMKPFYMMRGSMGSLLDVSIQIITQRGLLAPGGHVAWAALSGVAIVLSRGTGPLTASQLNNPRFYKIFIIPIVLHGLWDAPIMQEASWVKLISLVIAVWVVVLIFINMGLDQVKQLKSTPSLPESSPEAAPTPEPEPAPTPKPTPTPTPTPSPASSPDPTSASSSAPTPEASSPRAEVDPQVEHAVNLIKGLFNKKSHTPAPTPEPAPEPTPSPEAAPAPKAPVPDDTVLSDDEPELEVTDIEVILDPADQPPRPDSESAPSPKNN